MVFLKAKGVGPKQCTLQSEGFFLKNQKKTLFFSRGKQQNPGSLKERTPRQKSVSQSLPPRAVVKYELSAVCGGRETKSAWSVVAQYWRSQNRHCISSQSLSTWEQTHIVPPDSHCVPPHVPDRRPIGHFGRRLPTRGGVGGRPRPPGFQYPSEKVWQEFLVCCHPQEAPQPALSSLSPSPLLSPGRGSTNANMSCIAQASGLTFGVYALANCQYQTCLSPSHAPSPQRSWSHENSSGVVGNRDTGSSSLSRSRPRLPLLSSPCMPSPSSGAQT